MIKDNELISVIVPIYKTQNDLKNCVNSIIKQSYKKLEIILVDDGSPDKCPQICDELEKTDVRIRVIHKANGGLSDARNAGLEMANGQFIIFVDSDDMIHNEMIERLYKACIRNNTKMAVCNFRSVDTSIFSYDKIIKEYVDDNTIELLNSENAIKYSLDVYKMFQVSAWNKLYHRTLFENIRYPVGKYYEDIGTTYKLIDGCDNVSYLHAELYFYQIRVGSITHSGFNNRDLDKIEYCNEIKEFISRKYPGILNEALIYQYVYCYMKIVDKILDCKKIDNTYLDKMLNEMKQNRKNINLSKVPFKKKFSFSFLLWNKKIYKKLKSRK